MPVVTPAKASSSASAGGLASHFGSDLEDDLDGEPDEPDNDRPASSATKGRTPAPMTQADDGSLVRIPDASIYPGEPPYAAPALGFHPKVGALFDAFVYLPASNGAGGERPAGFLPVIGLVGDSPEKDKSPSWKLYGRIRPDVWKSLAVEIGEPADGPTMPACVMVNAMRSESLALFSIAKPNQLFAANPWVATMPLCVMRTPMSTIDEPQAHTLARAEKARQQLAKVAPDLKLGQQMSFTF